MLTPQISDWDVLVFEKRNKQGRLCYVVKFNVLHNMREEQVVRNRGLLKYYQGYWRILRTVCATTNGTEYAWTTIDTIA